jgi:hypothetical protein
MDLSGGHKLARCNLSPCPSKGEFFGRRLGSGQPESKWCGLKRPPDLSHRVLSHALGEYRHYFQTLVKCRLYHSS